MREEILATLLEFLCLSRQNEMVIVVSLSRRLLLYWMHLLAIERLCVFFQAPKQFSPDMLSSRHLFSSTTAVAASAPDVLQGFG